jgi:hypothetical protein
MLTNKDSEAIEALDLTPIKMKLMHVESGEGWTHAKAEAVEAEYRKFLYLLKKYPNEQFAPTVDVDTFWHYHILDTMKYAKNCQEVFGYFLHHDPYVGIGEDAAPEDHVQAGQRMRELYEAEFGSGLDSTHADATTSAWCTKASADARTAWCTKAAPGPTAAWCTKAVPDTKAAWCTRAPGAKAAWCTKAAPDTRAAWCTRAAPDARAAWCTRAIPDTRAAWCTKAATDGASSEAIETPLLLAA